MKMYAGIGSRTTPAHALSIMREVASRIIERDFALRSGGAIGADTAFMIGALASGGMIELYLPWNTYETWIPTYKNKDSKIKPQQSSQVIISENPSIQALEHASNFHPNWPACTQGAQKLHARNSEIVLGKNLDDPVSCIVCWHTDSGGTMQATRIATKLRIPMLNLSKNKKSIEEILDWMNDPV